MNNDKHWRLGAVTAIVTRNVEVILVNQEETKLVNKFFREKVSGGMINKKCNLLEDFEVKIDSPLLYNNNYAEWEYLLDLSFYIRSSELVNPEKWYHLNNLNPSFVRSILQQNTIDKDTGIFKEKFYPIISPSVDVMDTIGIVSTSMKEYTGYLDESIRDLNCKTKKKTKKWVPGHRYDSSIETIYLLCKTKIRSDESEYDDTPKLDAWIYTNEIEQGVTSVSDVLMTKTFGNEKNDLKVLLNIPSGFVESGEVLKNDFTEIDDYLTPILSKEVHRYYSDVNSFNRRPYMIGENLKHLITVLNLTVNGINSEYFQKTLKYVIKKFGYFVLYREYDTVILYSKKLKLSSKNSKDENINILESLIYFNLPNSVLSGKIDKIAYYNSLLGKYGLTLTEIATELIEEWNPLRFCDSFESYIENLDYFEPRSINNYVDLRKKSRPSTLTNNTTNLNKVVGPYIEEEIKLILKTLDSPDSDYYCECTTWAGGHQTSYIKVKIKLTDILQRYNNDFSKMPKDLKNEIVHRQFTQIEILYDATADIKSL